MTNPSRSEFNPGDGWRRARPDEPFSGFTQERYIHVFSDDHAEVEWVRDEPVPPLPTEPYTVIRVTWVDDSEHIPPNFDVLALIGDEKYSWIGLNDQWPARFLPRLITGFEVLSEPRPMTAKAVLARVNSLHYPLESMADVYREFGVDL